jgi:hypothetical protein
MKYPYLIVTIICFNTLIADAQKPIGITNEIDKRNFSVVLDGISFLKHRATLVYNFNDSAVAGMNQTVYDSLISRFYDLSYLRDSIKDQKQPYLARMHLQKAILYNIDHQLDVLPMDSVWLSPLTATGMAADSASYPPHTLVVYYPLAGEPFYHTVILFSEAGKIFFVSPLIHFDKRKDPGDIERFTRRHGYHIVEPYLWKP